VAAGRLDRFGFVDPTNGGSSQSGTLGVYYRKPFASGDTFKMDGFVSRSLLDLYSNFTFYLEDPEHGDAFQQHDSRYQQGFNTQYLRLNSVFGARGLLALGTNFHHNQIHVGLFPQIARNPTGVTTRGRAGVTNFAGYAQQGLDLARSRVHVEAGVRWDGFRFRVDDEIFPEFSGAQRAARWQPKAALAYTPSWRVPLRLHVNYGRGISSQDARGVVQRPESPRLAATDFFQFGTSHRWRRVSLVSDLFLIDRSNEQVYVPDDGSVEFFGPSRAYGYEAKTAVELTRRLMLHAGWTQVMNAFFRGASPRRYVASAPHCVVNGALTLNGWRGFFASLRYRHIGNYRLDEEDATVRAAGFDVVDLSVTRALTRRLDFSVAADNLTNKVYYETQNSFVSRLRPDAPAVARIHATPGFPFGVTLGLTFHLRSK
jgi:outer membrane receptor protein involved in Fe transport